MSLFVDETVPSGEDLLRYDSSVHDVVSAERIDLAEKVELARGEVRTRLAEFLRNHGSGAEGIGQVVMTEPLVRWLSFHCLAVVYRDAHFAHLNDRYGGKWKHYSQQADAARVDLYRAGVGLALNPLRRPGAPQVSSASGTLSASTYFIQISWVGAGGVESEASEVVAYTLAAPGTVRVVPVDAPAGVVGWNLFAGSTESEIVRQNGVYLPLAEAWEVPISGLIPGKKPGSGQEPDVYVRSNQILFRG